MINSAEEFVQLRTSDIEEEQYRASHDKAAYIIWIEIIQKFPDYKTWVVHNKTVPLPILQLLAQDTEVSVRVAVARKRKIDETIFKYLANDPNENVRYALMCNTKLPKEKKKQIQVEDSQWLQRCFKKQLEK